MKLEELYIQHPPKDLASTKHFIRITPRGEPQLIRIEPLFNDDFELIESHALVYIDECETPEVMERGVISSHVGASSHFPLHDVLNWKHHLVH
jgi:hypothetical protein